MEDQAVPLVLALVGTAVLEAMVVHLQVQQPIL
jgi:hypothetical protein